MLRFPLQLVLALVVMTTGVIAPVAGATGLPGPGLGATIDASLPIEPLLQAAAQLDPKTQVRVIVQKANPLAANSDVAKVAKAKVVEEFTIIPAFTADVKLKDVMALAGSPDVRYVSLDAITKQHSSSFAKGAPKDAPAAVLAAPVAATQLHTVYPLDVMAPSVWNPTVGPGSTGSGVTVAVIDTGLDLQHPDFQLSNVSAVSVNATAAGKTLRPDFQGDSKGYGKKNSNTTPGGTQDGYGHGTHVAGIIAAHTADGQYLGIAPNATLIGVKVADDAGHAFESDLLRGLEWVYLNKSARNIRVVNMSVGTSVPGSYATSPIDAAVESLWHGGVTVVVAAGNTGNASDAVSYAPANDPYVITVGCLDDNQTPSPVDDSLCPISGRGTTLDGFAKPDVIAPGRKIVSALASGTTVLGTELPDRITPDGVHLRLSGTSMSTPVVAGTVALLLERYPLLTPDQIKSILTGSTTVYPGQADAAGAVNAARAMGRAATPGASMNSGLLQLPGLSILTGFGSALWDGSRWSTATWDGSRWSSSTWTGSRWSGSTWDGSRWSSATWDGSRWSSAVWEGSRWSAAPLYD